MATQKQLTSKQAERRFISPEEYAALTSINKRDAKWEVVSWNGRWYI